jgi:hypothetical protein
MSVCIIEFVVVLFKMLSCNALFVVSGMCLFADLGDRRGYSHLKEEALDRIKWRNRFGRGCGPVVWQITYEWMNEWI